MDLNSIDPAENRRRMANGELYYASTWDLGQDRLRCKKAYTRYNSTVLDVSRRQRVEMLKALHNDTSPMPPVAATPKEDVALFNDYPWIDGPITMDYGYNVKLGKGVYVNANSVWIDTCTITVGARTLIGPNCSFYSGTHPLDPFVRNGTRGPESGKPITIGEDCWLGGNCIVLPGVTIGRGVTVGAGSVVTKDVPPYVCVVGNPARILKKIDVSHHPDAHLDKGEVAETPDDVDVLAGETVTKAS